MKKIIWIVMLSLCVLLVGCGNNGENSKNDPDGKANLGQKTAVLCTNMTTGSDSPEIKEHKWEYSGTLTAEVLAEGLSQLTGLDYLISVSEAKDGISIDWADKSTLIANLDNREQKEEFHFFEANSMRWFMMDSLWLTLTKNLQVENVYYTMKGGQDLVFEEQFSPINEFPSDLPYMGSAFFFNHMDGSGRGDLIDEDPISEEEAITLVREVMKAQEKEASSVLSFGWETVDGERAMVITAGEKSADGKKFTILYYFAVTDSARVFYIDLKQGVDMEQELGVEHRTGWILFDQNANG